MENLMFSTSSGFPSLLNCHGTSNLSITTSFHAQPTKIPLFLRTPANPLPTKAKGNTIHGPAENSWAKREPTFYLQNTLKNIRCVQGKLKKTIFIQL